MDEPQRDGAGSAPAGPSEGLEACTVANAPDQAERRFRPRARRARSTARPPRVRIRPRKPWVLLRLRLLGWKVRFKRKASSRWPARSEWGLRAGGDERFSVEAARFQAQCGAVCVRESSSGAPRARERIPPLVDSGRGCYVARLARLRPGRLRTSPAGPQGLDQADTETTRRGHLTQISGRRACIVHRSPHLWTLLWTEEAGAP